VCVCVCVCVRVCVCVCVYTMKMNGVCRDLILDVYTNDGVHTHLDHHVGREIVHVPTVDEKQPLVLDDSAA